jgi:hypothetical protein
MKKIKVLLLAGLLLIAGITSNSCLGPFNLTLKLHHWNSSIGSKWVNNVVFWAFCIIPVYEFSLFLDAVIFNVIEFWSGSNPISMKEGEKDIQIVSTGKYTYEVTATKNKFQIQQLSGPAAGEMVEIIFEPETYSCFLKYQGDLVKLVEYLPGENGTEKVNLFMPDGSLVTMDAGERNLDVIDKALSSVPDLLAKGD